MWSISGLVHLDSFQLVIMEMLLYCSINICGKIVSVLQNNLLDTRLDL